MKKRKLATDNIYLLIYHEIVDQITTGKLRPEAKLPSEHELAAEYGTSRETVRKALNLLAEHGYIHKIRGKGSFVLHLNKYEFPVSGLVSFQEMMGKLGKSSKTYVYELKREVPDSYIQKQLRLAKREKVWKVIRAREIEGEKIILDRDFFLASTVPSLTEKICEGSIYEYLEKQLQLKISFAKKVITVEECTAEDQAYLDMKGHTYIVKVQNYVYLDDATLFQYTESRHRPDSFRFTDFARRQ